MTTGVGGGREGGDHGQANQFLIMHLVYLTIEFNHQSPK